MKSCGAGRASRRCAGRSAKTATYRSVVDDCGARITRVDHKKQPIASDAWRAFAKRDPLGAATALLEVFRSVVDYGGYLIKDFTPHQFTLHGNKLYLVDGPDVALDGPMAAFLRGRPGLCGGNQPVDGARRRAAACSNALPSFPMQKACRATCPTMRTRFSRGPACCCPYPGTCASTAARDLCHLDQTRCHLIQNRPHATDAATAWWALPLSWRRPEAPRRRPSPWRAGGCWTTRAGGRRSGSC